MKKYFFLFLIYFIPLLSYPECPWPDEDDVVTFCTEENSLGITFPAATDGDINTYMETGCLVVTPAPAWFLMQIENPGELVMIMKHSADQDIDFACWGPFSGNTKREVLETLCSDVYQYLEIPYIITNTEALGSWDYYSPTFRFDMNYPTGTLVDCSFHTNSTEYCYIPHAQKGEWYLLLITNYSQYPGSINFNKVEGTATTDCKIIIDISNSGPVCEGETLTLDVNNVPAGAQFSWTGPNGFSSTLRNPVIPNMTKEKAGNYELVLFANGQFSDPVKTTVIVNDSYAGNEYATIQEGETFQFGPLSLTAPGDYIHNFFTSSGCDSIVNLHLELQMDVFASNNGPYCTGKSIQLQASNVITDATFLWTGPENFSSTEQNPVISHAQKKHEGTYTVTMTTAYTTSTSSTFVSFNEPEIKSDLKIIPEGSNFFFEEQLLTNAGYYSRQYDCDSIKELHLVTVSSNAPFCEGSQLRFAVNGAPANANYLWKGPNGFTSTLSDPVINNPDYSFNGEYEVEININGMTAHTHIPVTIYSEYFTEDIKIIPEGGSYIFKNQLLTQSGHYTETFTSVTGCDSIIDLILITINTNSPVCEGESLWLEASGVPTNSTHFWNGPDGFSSPLTNTTITHTNKKDSGAYTFSVQKNGKTFSASINASIHPNYMVYDTIRMEYDKSSQFGDLLITEEGDYRHNFTSYFGCDSIVNLHVGIYYPIIPSSYFSPNGDGINDVWIIKNIEQYPEASVEIYDRFGKMISSYKEYDNTGGWDGTYQGKDVPATDYWYVISVKDTDKTFMGHFTLIRR
jgi:gliding motility-associated-like protein